LAPVRVSDGDLRDFFAALCPEDTNTAVNIWGRKPWGIERRHEAKFAADVVNLSSCFDRSGKGKNAETDSALRAKKMLCCCDNSVHLGHYTSVGTQAKQRNVETDDKGGSKAMKEHVAVVFNGFLNLQNLEKLELVNAINEYFDSNDRESIRKAADERFAAFDRTEKDFQCKCCGAKG